MANVPFLVIVVGKMEVGIGTIGAIVAMSCGDNAADGKAAVDMRVWAMLEGVPKRSTVRALQGGVIREQKGSPESIMVPRLGGFVSANCGINYNGFSKGHGGTLEDLCISGYVAGRLGNGEQAP